jgi:CHAT domain-containing protein
LIFAEPQGRRRLAVLSACHAGMPGVALPDEVISFPSAMLQAGVAGVVSSQVGVGDASATLLVLRFLHRVEEGVAPARALAEAQGWLRSATNEQIHDALPAVHPVPAGRSGRLLAHWQAQRPYTEPYAWATFSYSGA